MKRIKVLLGNDDYYFGNGLAKLLRTRNFYVITRPDDGNLIYDAIRNELPDVVILEPFLHSESTKYVIEKTLLSRLHKPNFIVVSDDATQFNENDAKEIGADFYMQNPLDIDLLFEKIISLVGGNLNVEQYKLSLGHEILHSSVEIEVLTTNALQRIGVPQHLKGFRYLRFSINSAIEDPSLLDNITKVLYPAVAKMYNTTSQRVERSIRHAIDIAWQRGSYDTMIEYFGEKKDYFSQKPTNREFIATVTDKISLMLKAKDNDINLDSLGKLPV